MSQRQIFFLHIPKTAGTSLRQMLERKIGLKDTLLVMSTDDLRQNLPKLANYKLVTGHLWYALQGQMQPNCYVMTFLRQPLDRAVSSFYYFKTLSRQELSRHVGSHSDELFDSLRADDLKTFVKKNQDFARRELGQRQARDLARRSMPAGFSLTDSQYELTSAELTLARENLAQCDLVGLAERFLDSTALLHFGLGWTLGSEILEKNKMVRPKTSQLDSETFELLTEICSADIQLYADGVKLFESRWKAALSTMLSEHRLALVHAAEPVPRYIHYTFDCGALDRFGFHEPEFAGDRWVCWTGPDERSGFEFEVNTRNRLRIAIKLAATYDLESFETLRFYVDGREYASSMHERLTHEIFIPVGRCNNPSKLRLEIISKTVRPSELSPEHQDTRQVGVCIESVQIESVPVLA